MKRKDMSEKEFKIMILSEMFAREIQDTIDDGSFENETLEIILNSVCTTWNYTDIIGDIYKHTATILKKEYDLDMEELKLFCKKNI